MNITLNGESKSLEGDVLTVAELLKNENVDMPDMVSVQLNGEFIEKDAFGNAAVKEGDAVDFMYFMGGGQA